MTGYFNTSFSGRLRHEAGGGSNLDAHRRSAEAGRQVRMLLSFQRPSRLAWEGIPPMKRSRRAALRLPERAAEYSAPRPVGKDLWGAATSAAKAECSRAGGDYS